MESGDEGEKKIGIEMKMTKMMKKRDVFGGFILLFLDVIRVTRETDLLASFYSCVLVVLWEIDCIRSKLGQIDYF